MRRRFGEKARVRLSNPEFCQKHLDAHNTEIYRKKLSEKVRDAYQQDDVKERHCQSVNSEEYKSRMATFTKDLWTQAGHREKVSLTLKTTLSSPEKRKSMSDAAKASTAKRLETRRRNFENKNNH